MNEKDEKRSIKSIKSRWILQIRHADWFFSIDLEVVFSIQINVCFDVEIFQKKFEILKSRFERYKDSRFWYSRENSIVRRLVYYQFDFEVSEVLRSAIREFERLKFQVQLWIFWFKFRFLRTDKFYIMSRIAKMKKRCLI